MGEAKRRGTYEERKALAIERDKNKPPRKPKQNISNKGFAELLMLLGMMGGRTRFRGKK